MVKGMHFGMSWVLEAVRWAAGFRGPGEAGFRGLEGFPILRWGCGFGAGFDGGRHALWHVMAVGGRDV